jgi:hypothetical protein
MRPGADVFEDDPLKIAAGNTLIIEEDVKAVMGQILVDSQRPEKIGASVTDENGFSMRLMAHVYCLNMKLQHQKPSSAQSASPAVRTAGVP